MMKSGILHQTVNSTLKIKKSILREYKYINIIDIFSESYPPSSLKKTQFLNKLKSSRIKYLKKLLVHDNYGTSGTHNKYIYKRITPNFRKSLKRYQFNLFTFFQVFRVEKSKRGLDFLSSIEWDFKKRAASNIVRNRNLKNLKLTMIGESLKQREKKSIKIYFENIIRRLCRSSNLKSLLISCDKIICTHFPLLKILADFLESRKKLNHFPLLKILIDDYSLLENHNLKPFINAMEIIKPLKFENESELRISLPLRTLNS